MTIRTALLLGVLLTPTTVARADDAKPIEPGPWKFGTTAGLNLSQSAFSSNWAGGDHGSLVWVVNTQSSAERQFTTAFNWSNTLNLAYGQTAQQTPGTSASKLRWESPDKTTDAIALQSVARWTTGGLVDPYGALGVESQFQDESDPRGKLTFNPIKLKESAGAARQLFKTDDSEGLTRLGFALRQTFAHSFDDPLGKVKTSFVTNDGGIEWQTDLKRPVLQKKVLYQSRLLVYQPLFYSKSSDLDAVDAALRAVDPGRESIADFWKATDVSFDNHFTAQITKSLGVTLVAQWVYDKFDVAALVDPKLASSTDAAVQAAYAAQIDKNVRKAGQFREVLALALTYRLF